MADDDSIEKTTLADDVWGLVFLSQQADSLLEGAKEIIGDGPDTRTFHALQIIEVAMEKLSSITNQYCDLKIRERLKAEG